MGLFGWQPAAATGCQRAVCQLLPSGACFDQAWLGRDRAAWSGRRAGSPPPSVFEQSAIPSQLSYPTPAGIIPLDPWPRAKDDAVREIAQRINLLRTDLRAPS